MQNSHSRPQRSHATFDPHSVRISTALHSAQGDTKRERTDRVDVKVLPFFRRGDHESPTVFVVVIVRFFGRGNPSPTGLYMYAFTARISFFVRLPPGGGSVGDGGGACEQNKVCDNGQSCCFATTPTICVVRTRRSIFQRRKKPRHSRGFYGFFGFYNLFDYSSSLAGASGASSVSTLSITSRASSSSFSSSSSRRTFVKLTILCPSLTRIIMTPPAVLE